MKRTHQAWPLALLVLTGCASSQAEGVAASPSPAGYAVRVQPAQRADLVTESVLSGDVRAETEAQLSAKVGGRLALLAVDEGSQVRAGQVIARLDLRDFQLQVLQAESGLASAEANRAAAVTRLANAEDTLRRYGALHREGGVSEQQMQASRTEVQAGQHSVAAADAQIAQSRAAIAIARKALSDAEVRAPFAGVVTKKSTEVGTMLSPMTPIVTLAAVRSLEVQVPVGQAQLGGVHVGLEASFQVPTHPGRNFTARVSEVAPTLDTKTRTAQVTLRLPNDQGLLSPGMFARVRLPLARREGAVVVPPAALVADKEKLFLFVVEGGKAERREVAVGLRTPERVEIASGLRAGEAVVVLGQGQLQPGDAVRVVEGK